MSFGIWLQGISSVKSLKDMGVPPVRLFCNPGSILWHFVVHASGGKMCSPRACRKIFGSLQMLWPKVLQILLP